MKLKIVSWMMLLFFSIVPLYAQQTQRERPTPAEREKARIEKMATTLQLNAEQKKKFTTVCENHRKEMTKLRNSMKEKSREEQQKIMQEQRTKHDKEIKKILTDEQYKKYQAEQKKQREAFRNQQRPQRRNNGAPMRPGNQPNRPGGPQQGGGRGR